MEAVQIIYIQLHVSTFFEAEDQFWLRVGKEECVLVTQTEAKKLITLVPGDIITINPKKFILKESPGAPRPFEGNWVYIFPVQELLNNDEERKIY